jgi:8-oxo-dGTP diphosphatase
MADGTGEAPTTAGDELVRAGGAVVWRRRGAGVEILLVHRPRYDDWSFPKGKSGRAESDEDCAVREVEEETSLRVTLGAELPSTSYVVRGSPKRVRYWLAEAERPDSARAQNEIDAVAWLPPDHARERLSYERDHGVLRAALERLDEPGP